MPNRAVPPSSPGYVSVHPILRVQGAAGNQAIQRLRLGTRLHAQLTVGQPDDEYEREAERVADTVAFSAAPAPRPRCACGGTPSPEGECAPCRANRLALQPLAVDHSGVADVPPVVSEVVRSQGQPLDPASRAFFDSRLGFDFSPVRVHTDAQAAESVQVLGAEAYTIGRDVVFGAGRYAPETTAGRRLLAHELVHVAQQHGSGSPETRVQRAPDVPDVIQRKPAPQAAPEHSRAVWLTRLARDPREAHGEWKKLSTEDKFGLLYEMTRLYDASFADQFREVAQHGKPEFVVTYWQPGSGPSPKQLKDHGWRFLEMEVTGTGAIDVEVWVHPSGRTIRRDVSTYRFGRAEPEKAPPVEPPEKVPPGKRREDQPPKRDPKATKALQWLRQMERQNDRLQELSATDHPNWDKVRLAFVRFDEADNELQKVRDDPDLDMPGTFYRDVDAAKQENLDLLNVFSDLDPSFRAYPVVIPEGPEED